MKKKQVTQTGSLPATTTEIHPNEPTFHATWEKDLWKKTINHRKEIFYSSLGLTVTGVASLMLLREAGLLVWETWVRGDHGLAFLQTVFTGIFLYLIYGNLVYQTCRFGYIRRLKNHQPVKFEMLETVYEEPEHEAEVCILVPSYKEELDVIRKALLSSALQDYPNRRVVLLLDDPPDAASPEDQFNLKAARQLPDEIAAFLSPIQTLCHKSAEEYARRFQRENLDCAEEYRLIAEIHTDIAAWFDQAAERHPILDHSDELFVRITYMDRAAEHRDRARRLCLIGASSPPAEWRKHLRREHERLDRLFAANISSFERKQYVNLSRASNKAMNLNSYIGLMGLRLKELSKEDGIHLVPCAADEQSRAGIEIPDADYIVTLDADSILIPNYVLRLVNIMQQPENERVAVIQTPYSAIPHAPSLLERVAGATTDMQYIVHQGFTHFRATYWVGANAVLRRRALLDIAVYVSERGHRVVKFIQDQTVIEDTESSIDLIAQGWLLHNYPERLSYSATPSDFGSLLIQRRRWANGGLIIAPKLLSYLWRGPKKLTNLWEGLVRFHYLTSLAATNMGILIILTLPLETYFRILWLPLTALPYYIIYARDLLQAGYNRRDLFRVYAINMLLLPINLSGVLESIRQIITRRPIPFCRTPKIGIRTSAPARYILAEYGLFIYCLTGSLIDGLAQRWMHASFAFINALIFWYGINFLMERRANQEDVVRPLLKSYRNLVLEWRSGNARPARRLAGLAGSTGLILYLFLATPSAAKHKPASYVPVLIYHQIVTEESGFNEELISLNRFKEQMDYLSESGYHTLSGEEFRDFLKGEPVPQRSVLLTFDDGWKSILNAVPVLNKHEFQATFFLITGAMNGDYGDDYITWDDVISLASNPRFEIASHTVNHPWNPHDNMLTWTEGQTSEKGPEDALAEIAESKRQLEQHIGKEVKFLAWPCGWYNQPLIEMAQHAGYTHLFTAWRGLTRPDSDRLIIRRNFVDGSQSLSDFRKILTTVPPAIEGEEQKKFALAPVFGEEP